MGREHKLQPGMAADYKMCLIFRNATFGLLRGGTYCEAHTNNSFIVLV